MARRRGGHHEAELHADALRLLADADYPSPVKQVILMALRGGKPGKQVCVVCQRSAQYCQLWVPPALTQAVPDLTAKPTVYWLCDAHHGQVSDAEIVAFLTKQHRSRKGKR